MIGILVSVLHCGVQVVCDPSFRGILTVVLLLYFSIRGLLIARYKELEQWQISLAAYLICIGLHLSAVDAETAYGGMVWWVAVQVGLCGFVLDFAAVPFTLKTLSFLWLLLSKHVIAGQQISSREMLIFSTFLLLGYVLTWISGKTRVDLIFSREQTQVRADTDMLTGLTVRATAREEIQRALNDPEDEGVLILLDLDNFKNVNDQFGHQTGDDVLIDVAAELKSLFRSGDIICRLGGDEFVVYMRGVPEEEWAKSRADQIVAALIHTVNKDTASIRISVSVGYVMTRDVGRTFEELYHAADIAMYQAKKSGGNRSVRYLPEAMGKA